MFALCIFAIFVGSVFGAITTSNFYKPGNWYLWPCLTFLAPAMVTAIGGTICGINIGTCVFAGIGSVLITLLVNLNGSPRANKPNTPN